MLCLHGFPDNAHTYDSLLPALAAAGFRGGRAVHARLRADLARTRRPLPVGAARPGRRRAHRGAGQRSRVRGRPRLGRHRRLRRGGARSRARHAPGHDRRRASRRRARRRWPHATSGTRASGTRTSSRCRSPSRSWPPTTSLFSSSGGATPRRSSIPRRSIERVKATFREPGVVTAALGYYRHTFHPGQPRPGAPAPARTDRRADDGADPRRCTAPAIGPAGSRRSRRWTICS